MQSLEKHNGGGQCCSRGCVLFEMSHLMTGRALGAGVYPQFHGFDKVLVGTRRGGSSGARLPSPANQRIIFHMMHKFLLKGLHVMSATALGQETVLRWVQPVFTELLGCHALLNDHGGRRHMPNKTRHQIIGRARRHTWTGTVAVLVAASAIDRLG